MNNFQLQEVLALLDQEMELVYGAPDRCMDCMGSNKAHYKLFVHIPKANPIFLSDKQAYFILYLCTACLDPILARKRYPHWVIEAQEKLT